VRGAVTACAHKVDRVLQGAAITGVLDGIATLVCDAEDRKGRPAILQHLGHERQGVDITLSVEGRQDLLAAADTDHVTAANRSHAS